MSLATFEDVLRFWFESPARDHEDARRKMRRWFVDGPALDAEVKARFLPTLEAALRGELDAWADAPRSRLALVLVLDQFPRDAFRGTPRAWAGDAKAQALCVDALDRGMDEDLDYVERAFLGMPLVHAEDLGLQRLSKQ
jgi:uncharacterized protein (DUF924 family)